MCDFEQLQKLLLEGEYCGALSDDYVDDFDLDFNFNTEFNENLINTTEESDEDENLLNSIDNDNAVISDEFLNTNPIKITDEEYNKCTALEEEVSLEYVSSASQILKDDFSIYFKDTCLRLKEQNNLFKIKNKALIKKASTERAAKSHRELALKIDIVYNTLPETYIITNNLARITKYQKLDQIQKFVRSVQRHGYVAN